MRGATGQGLTDNGGWGKPRQTGSAKPLHDRLCAEHGPNPPCPDPFSREAYVCHGGEL